MLIAAPIPDVYYPLCVNKIGHNMDIGEDQNINTWWTKVICVCNTLKEQDLYVLLLLAFTPNGKHFHSWNLKKNLISFTPAQIFLCYHTNIPSIIKVPSQAWTEKTKWDTFSQQIMSAELMNSVHLWIKTFVCVQLRSGIFSQFSLKK